MQKKLNLLATAILMGLAVTSMAGDSSVEPYYPWTAKDFAIEMSLGGLKGDAERGRKLAANGSKGNCLACHQLPITEEEFHGEVGPPLHGLATRYSEAEIRMRLVNIQEINPFSLMPPFYKKPDELTQVSKKYLGKTVLTAQEVEDVLAYLMTLK
jgi:sulfur-oxidizing protein SoxX